MMQRAESDLKRRAKELRDRVGGFEDNATVRGKKL